MGFGRRGTKDLLRDVPLFADCSPDELALVAGLAEELTLEDGHHLVHEGHRGGVFTVLLDGTADVLVDDERVRTLGSGDFFGEIATVVGGRRTATVVATSPVRVLTLSDTALDRVLSRSPGLRAKIEHTAWERMQGPAEAHDAP